jgi:adenylosuccinate lyase
MLKETNRSIFRNLSPLDHRYLLSNRELFEELEEFISEDGTVKYTLKVEGALLIAHLKRLGLDSAENVETVLRTVEEIEPEEVYREEEKTNHNIRALVNVMKARLPEELSPYVHLGATSVDMMDSSAALRYRDVTLRVIAPLLLRLQESLIGIAEAEADTPQVGRTHGQHAVPITLGFALSEYVARLGKSIARMVDKAEGLRGKLSGAVGGYNAMALIVEDPQAFEKEVLGSLGLEASEYSNQIVEPEYLLQLLLEFNTAFGIIANLADDLRHLQRTEIGELQEFFSSTQVGSSTMPHKRNPWNSEHVKSLWKAFSPRVLSFFMDQISEHQRDLTNSASARFVSDYIAGFAAGVNRMLRIVETLHVERENLEKNLRGNGDLILSEAAYILLSQAGEPEAHEKVRRITLECEESGASLLEKLREDPKTWEAVDRQLRRTVGIDGESFFTNPAFYRGRTVEKTLELTRRYRKKLTELRDRLGLKTI